MCTLIYYRPTEAKKTIASIMASATSEKIPSSQEEMRHVDNVPDRGSYDNKATQSTCPITESTIQSFSTLSHLELVDQTKDGSKLDKTRRKEKRNQIGLLIKDFPATIDTDCNPHRATPEATELDRSFASSYINTTESTTDRVVDHPKMLVCDPVRNQTFWLKPDPGPQKEKTARWLFSFREGVSSSRPDRFFI